jgi:hypothetical protein
MPPALREALLKYVREKERPVLDGTLKAMIDQDQQDIADFAVIVTTGWLDRPANRQEAMLFLYGFVLGHDWVKEHWSLW